jgi:hypothetical protein
VPSLMFHTSVAVVRVAIDLVLTDPPWAVDSSNPSAGTEPGSNLEGGKIDGFCLVNFMRGAKMVK